MRRSLTASALLLSGTLLAGCDDILMDNRNLNCNDVRSISLGSTATGTLEPNDCRLNDGSAVDYYRFRIGSGRDVYVSQQSSIIDPYVAILDDYGNVVAEEENGSSGYSELSVYLPSGTYYIAASSYSPGDYGTYYLDTDYN